MSTDTVRSTQHSTAPAPHHAISRGTFLRSAALLGAGTVGLGGITTAGAAPTASASPAHTAATEAGTASARLPHSWEGTVFTAPLPGETQGYITSFTHLRDHGAISSLSARSIAAADGIANFADQGDSDTETFTPHVSGTAHLDRGPVTIRFVGDAGTVVTAQVRLTRTANPMVRGLILHVSGASKDRTALPARTPIIWGWAPVDSPAQVTAKEFTELLATAAGLCFAEDGRNPAHVDKVSIHDQGRHITARIRIRTGGRTVSHRWFGTAVGCDGGWSYICGQLPDA